MDFGGGDEIYRDEETMEERVRREHDEGAEQRAGNSGSGARVRPVEPLSKSRLTFAPPGLVSLWWSTDGDRKSVV